MFTVAVAALAIFACPVCSVLGGGHVDEPVASSATSVGQAIAASDPSFELRTLRGRVVWASAALARRFQISEVPEAADRVLVLEERQGQLHPLVEDIRGRAFRLDGRLRDTELELLVRRHVGSPFVQVIQVFESRAGERLELDYWCEICSIAMFELKECECCQGPIELRRQPVSPERARQSAK